MDITQIKNINNTIKDMQKQINQLKSQASIFKKQKRGEYLLKCSSGGVEFKQYDLCKVVSGVAQKYDGSEAYDDEFVPGVILDGNYGNSSADVLVQIGGITYIHVSEDITAGMLLFPDSADYTKGTINGNVGFWKALEDADSDSLCKSMILGSAVGDSYNGYFKVSNTSREDGELVWHNYIKVTAGIALINDNIFNVDEVELEITDNDHEFVLLNATLTQAVLQTSDEYTYQDGESSTIIATFTITDGKIEDLEQQNHGMVHGLVLDECPPL